MIFPKHRSRKPLGSPKEPIRITKQAKGKMCIRDRRNITIEYLNTLVEERLRRGRHTGVSTNLTPGQLSERYGERIASRLLSPALCDVLGFQGKDLRLLPRR